jgi:transcriptional regulator GlxA family with amidase domain
MANGVRTTRVIAVLVFDGVRLLDVTGPVEVFDVAVTMGAQYQVLICSENGRDVTTSGGLRLGVSTAAADVRQIDTLIVAGGERLVAGPLPAHLVARVRDLGTNARRVASICAGAFALGHAGMLDRRQATTHWKHTAALAQAFPSAHVEEESIYVQDGPIYTSAGVTAGIDLMLALVAEDMGSGFAQAIARDLVMYSRRRGSQSQHSVPARTPYPTLDIIAVCCDAVVADPGADHTVNALAMRAGMSVRHFGRIFRKQVGCSPAQYVAAVRLDAALELLHAGEPYAVVARKTGIGSAETLRRMLRRAERR